MSENLVKWLLVGTGDIIRKRVAAALNSAPGGKVVAICGGRSRAAEIAAEHDIRTVYDDIERALAESSADAAYVATPVHRHCDEGGQALAASKHVLVEKPLGLSGDDATELATAAEKAGTVAGCAYYRRCFPRYGHLKRVIESGELGRIVGVNMCNYSYFNPSKDDPKYWRVQKAASGGGPLADIGSHMFDMLIGLFGKPVSTTAYCDTLVNDYEVEDTASILMILENGAHVTANFGWNTKTWRHEFEVVGSEGKVNWFPADSGKVVKTVGREVEEIDLPNADNVHEPLVEDFNMAINQGRPPIVPLIEAAKTNALMDAIYQSSQTGRKVKL